MEINNMIEINISKNLFNTELKANLTIQNGERIGIIGRSGSGKTTLLRIIAGLEKSEGFIKVDNIIWQDKNIYLIPQKRKTGFVFQDYALFPNMTITENLKFGMKDKKDIAKLDKMLRILELENFKNQKPDQLSGGQKQRVALGRAILSEPKILLLDEPFSAIDSELREKLRDELAKISKEFNLTFLLVSHDMADIEKLSDRVYKIIDGELKAV
jgi:molybdate transport system ATP-binding protein